MQNFLASTKEPHYLNSVFGGGNGSTEQTYRNPNGRQFRRRVEKANRKKAKSGALPAPEGFFINTLNRI